MRRAVIVGGVLVGCAVMVPHVVVRLIEAERPTRVTDHDEAHAAGGHSGGRWTVREIPRADLVEVLKKDDASTRFGAFELVVGVLTGEKVFKGLPRDQVAADLIDIAAAPDVSWKAQADIIAALTRSAAPDRRKRFAGAVDVLTEIHRRSLTPGVRAAAVGAVVEVASPDAAFGFLAPLAQKPDPRFPHEQMAAINLLAELDTERAAAFLRELHQGGRVTEYGALSSLRRHADAGYRVARNCSEEDRYFQLRGCRRDPVR